MTKLAQVPRLVGMGRLPRLRCLAMPAHMSGLARVPRLPRVAGLAHVPKLAHISLLARLPRLPRLSGKSGKSGVLRLARVPLLPRVPRVLRLPRLSGVSQVLRLARVLRVPRPARKRRLPRLTGSARLPRPARSARLARMLPGLRLLSLPLGLSLGIGMSLRPPGLPPRPAARRSPLCVAAGYPGLAAVCGQHDALVRGPVSRELPAVTLSALRHRGLLHLVHLACGPTEPSAHATGSPRRSAHTCGTRYSASAAVGRVRRRAPGRSSRTTPR
ncbi:hypothetical protein [Streptomyces chengmaiensis]|uniref:hypothetical protein n=1 Tax=Streptomyces chengmaiensis TaxID=3040919 RepID=UPI0029620B17|nr:hypothetical protein [Streptomyces chengmaiensis]